MVVLPTVAALEIVVVTVMIATVLAIRIAKIFAVKHDKEFVRNIYDNYTVRI